MANFNSVTLVGNLVRDVELKFTQGGSAVAKTAIVVNRKFKDNEEAMFIDLVFWGKQAELAGEYLSKGSPVLVQGRLTQNSWESPDGQKRTKHEVTVENMQFLSGNKQKERAPAVENTQSEVGVGVGEDEVPF